MSANRPPSNRDGADRSLTDRDYAALARFRHALRVFLRFSEDAAGVEGLTANQHQLLLAIRGFAGPEPPTITDVASMLVLQHNSTVELVGRAVEAGLVVRTPDPADRRRQRLSLTAEGEAKLARLTRAHRDELRRFRADLSGALRALG